MVIWIYVAFYLLLQSTASGEINVVQNPSTLSIPNGDTARMSCHWTSGDVQRVRVQWRKRDSTTGEENGTVVCSVLGTGNISEIRNNGTLCNVAKNSTTLTIEGVTKKDGGLYICNVIKDIPTLEKASGGGTRLYVQDDNRFLYLTLLLIIPILMSVFCLYYKRKKKKELFLDHIYGNVKINASRSSKKQNSQKKERKKASSQHVIQ